MFDARPPVILVARLCTLAGLQLQVRQLGRWLRAARQDLEPGVRFLHASYGVATLDAIRQVASDAEVRSLTGEDLVGVHQALTQLQDEAQRALEATPRGA